MFLTTLYLNSTALEAYLVFWHTSVIKLFSKIARSSCKLFLQKNSSIDVWLSQKYASLLFSCSFFQNKKSDVILFAKHSILERTNDMVQKVVKANVLQEDQDLF